MRWRTPRREGTSTLLDRIHVELLFCSPASFGRRHQVRAGRANCLQEHGAMTIVQAAVVVEAALIALLLLLQFRRPRAGRASATSKAPANASIESSKLVHGHFGFSRASAADATSAHHSDACPEQPSSGELSGPRQSLRQSWGAVRARLAMIFAQRIRRVASRRGAQDGREEPWVNMPDRPAKQHDNCSAMSNCAARWSCCHSPFWCRISIARSCWPIRERKSCLAMVKMS